ncbi:hypothetical protein SDC9_132981 [bioreactor metagenome]|uniref:Uncharacterized protein n=1 Tax=bioreactor metagenome TaxID=1076179 RepID=A0A645DA19_9ZZZZ
MGRHRPGVQHLPGRRVLDHGTVAAGEDQAVGGQAEPGDLEAEPRDRAPGRDHHGGADRADPVDRLACAVEDVMVGREQGPVDVECHQPWNPQGHFLHQLIPRLRRMSSISSNSSPEPSALAVDGFVPVAAVGVLVVAGRAAGVAAPVPAPGRVPAGG